LLVLIVNVNFVRIVAEVPESCRVQASRGEKSLLTRNQLFCIAPIFQTGILGVQPFRKGRVVRVQAKNLQTCA
jgi:hypothetical protein